jgi:hypothetical protein
MVLQRETALERGSEPSRRSKRRQEMNAMSPASRPFSFVFLPCSWL